MNDVGKLPLAALAEVRATSEDRDHPILLAFDEGDGPGASYWKAGDPGEQTIARPQEVQLALSTDGGVSYRGLLRQEFTFSPDGATWEHETWSTAQDQVTHVRLVIKPDKGQAFTRIFIRNLKTGRTSEQTMKSSDSYEVADVTDTDMQYLYSDGEYWHFMQPDTFEQHQAGKAGMGETSKCSGT